MHMCLAFYQCFVVEKRRKEKKRKERKGEKNQKRRKAKGGAVAEQRAESREQRAEQSCKDERALEWQWRSIRHPS
jgi:hypothetical protein